ncbi:MAG: GNAT family N-acetyltransferase [Kiloniellaceae bacterium]
MTKSESALEIRQASAADFRTALDWAAAEGWNPGVDDLAVFHATDPQGFYLGWIDDRPASSISVVRYGQDFGFLGFYIVHPDHRGSGAGIATWNHGMAYLASCATVGLDGVVAQQGNYRKSGFVLAGRNLRHSGVPALDELTPRAAIRPVTAADLPALLAYDQQFFAGPREAFSAAWALPGGDATRRALLAVADGEIAGYGVIRKCCSGHKVGPLFAEDAATAEALFVDLCRTAPGEEVSLDTPQDNAAALQLAARFGLAPAFETARMYRGPAPELPIQRTFGITTFELG